MEPFELDEEARAAYHAAASISSNFLVTLEESAARLLERAGVEDARRLLDAPRAADARRTGRSAAARR